jgi:hypothetical protein
MAQVSLKLLHQVLDPTQVRPRIKGSVKELIYADTDKHEAIVASYPVSPMGKHGVVKARSVQPIGTVYCVYR